MQRNVRRALGLAMIGIVSSTPIFAAEAKTDTVEAAIARAADLSDRAAAIAKEAAEQKTQLEALRPGMASRGKELDDARAQLVALQKQVVELRAAVAERNTASLQHAA